MLYVLTMIELVHPLHRLCGKFAVIRPCIVQRKTLTDYSAGFFAWANEIFHQVSLPSLKFIVFFVTFVQFEPLNLHLKAGRKVFLDLGSRRGEYFSHFHKFYFLEDFEWVLFECNKYCRSRTSVNTRPALTRVFVHSAAASPSLRSLLIFSKSVESKWILLTKLFGLKTPH